MVKNLFCAALLLLASAPASAQKESREDRARRIWESMSPQRRAIILRNWARFSAMPPEKKKEIRGRFEQFKRLPPEKQTQAINKWERLQPPPALQGPAPQSRPEAAPQPDKGLKPGASRVDRGPTPQGKTIAQPKAQAGPPLEKEAGVKNVARPEEKPKPVLKDKDETEAKPSRVEAKPAEVEAKPPAGGKPELEKSPFPKMEPKPAPEIRSWAESRPQEATPEKYEPAMQRIESPRSPERPSNGVPVERRPPPRHR